MKSIIPNKWINLPSTEALKAFVQWDFSKLVEQSWKELSNVIGICSIAAILILMEEIVGDSYIKLVFPALVSVLFLHPFLKAGSQFGKKDCIPRQWRGSPLSLPWFSLLGIIPRVTVNTLGNIVFCFLMGVAGYSLAFMGNPLYWLFLILMIPGVIGWGLLINALLLPVNNRYSVQWGMRRFFELTGSVFLSFKSLPAFLYFIHFIIPHSYVVYLSRNPSWEQLSWVYLSTGILVSFGLFIFGMIIFLRFLDQSVRQGAIDRFS